MNPESGELASGLSGIGRMPEPQTILDYTSDFLKGKKKDLTGKKILITAGPTYEPIDEVRFIANYSSGKMGFQIAKAASLRGAEVTLITGPSYLETPIHVNRINVNTSEDMFNAVKEEFINRDCIIMSAAVADFKPKESIKGKIKKAQTENLIIETEKTKDILEFLGVNKGFLFLDCIRNRKTK
jgi:phosphopantothenoylcysteine decarboxylase/phosphopantothenate--cysteine ligase